MISVRDFIEMLWVSSGMMVMAPSLAAFRKESAFMVLVSLNSWRRSGLLAVI